MHPNNPEITHQVFFRLKHARHSAEEREFLRLSRELLSRIPGVQGFEVLRQVSDKADFVFGFSMRFADQDAYERYNAHAAHQTYVQQVWLEQVEAFQELDTIRVPRRDASVDSVEDG